MIELSGVPILETERLILRAPGAADRDAAVAFYMSDRATYVGGPFDRKQAYYAYISEIGHWVSRGFGMWAVTEKGDDTCLGLVGCWYPETWPEKEIGWTLWPAAEGKGIGYEAAVAARAHAYGTLGWTTAISLVAKGNDGSGAVAMRLGAVRDGTHTHPRFGDMDIYRHKGPGA